MGSHFLLLVQMRCLPPSITQRDWAAQEGFITGTQPNAERAATTLSHYQSSTQVWAHSPLAVHCEGLCTQHPTNKACVNATRGRCEAPLPRTYGRLAGQLGVNARWLPTLTCRTAQRRCAQGTAVAPAEHRVTTPSDTRRVSTSTLCCVGAWRKRASGTTPRAHARLQEHPQGPVGTSQAPPTARQLHDNLSARKGWWRPPAVTPVHNLCPKEAQSWVQPKSRSQSLSTTQWWTSWSS